ncbi:MAG: tRNA epoxyqueuosine(34) reductase QueG [Gammaproteobacteria bacterium]
MSSPSPNDNTSSKATPTVDATRRIFTSPEDESAHQHLLRRQLEKEATDLGFEKVGIASTDLRQDRERFRAWVADGLHADLDYLTRHGEKRFQPEVLVPGTVSIICVRLNYLFPGLDSVKTLNDRRKAYISRYALGRDYHKVLRTKLQKLATRLSERWGPFGYRVFTDSAPVLEKPLASQAGLGWMGKHTLILDKSVGSWFFLGELFTDLPLPISSPVEPHCGKCRACLRVCPTQAIIEPYRLDAGRCISYLTIENKGPIAPELRPLLGNRIFGCDDCQLICPWNRWAKTTTVADFTPRHGLDATDIVTLLYWDESDFLQRTAGNPLRRAGYGGWVRNLCVAAGNAPGDPALLQALHQKKTALSAHSADKTPAWLMEHLADAIHKQESRLGTAE